MGTYQAITLPHKLDTYPQRQYIDKNRQGMEKILITQCFHNHGPYRQHTICLPSTLKNKINKHN